MLNYRSHDEPISRIVSIDPARGNFSIRVEERIPPLLPRAKRDTTPRKIRMLLYQTWRDFSHKSKDQTLVYMELYQRLDKYRDLLSSCHLLIIEKQLPRNYKAIRLSQHTISWFLLRTESMVVEIPSSMKTRVLGAPKKMSYYNTKKWGVAKAKEILTQHEDKESLLILEADKKPDDLADTVCQLEAWLLS